MYIKKEIWTKCRVDWSDLWNIKEPQSSSFLWNPLAFCTASHSMQVHHHNQIVLWMWGNFCCCSISRAVQLSSAATWKDLLLWPAYIAHLHKYLFFFFYFTSLHCWWWWYCMRVVVDLWLIYAFCRVVNGFGVGTSSVTMGKWNLRSFCNK